jgi:hypothetical protein
LKIARVTNAVTRSRSLTKMLLRKVRFIKFGQTIGERTYRKPYHVDIGKDYEQERGISALRHALVT